MLFRFASCFALSCFFTGASISLAAPALTFTVTGGKTDQTNVVVQIPIEKTVGSSVVTLDGKPIPSQVAENSVIALIPSLKAEATVKGEVELIKANPAPTFSWKDAEGTAPVLQQGDKPVLAYVRPTFDPKATPPKQAAIANPTIKIYHHLYAADGTTLLTNGAQGQFPHHRGIYFGFNNISYDGKKADVWHCRNGEHQSHVKTLVASAGNLFAEHQVEVAWIGQDNKQFIQEQRGLKLFNVPGGRLIEFQSKLTTELEKVRLDGDPQHAGFHYRAAQEVEAKNKAQTYFLRPNGKGDLGKEVNWDAKNKGPKNLPWNAMSFIVGEKRYTVVYLDHPNNPKEARQSERTYGRIGTYFEYDLSKNKPLEVRYRLWIQEGELTVEQCNALSEAFVNPPKVVVGK